MNQNNPLVLLRGELDRQEFAKALPAHMPIERFKRVILTAIQRNPALLDCDRKSLWNAAMSAAQDGLLPDGREGAIVAFRDKQRGMVAQWFPMILGVRKKARNSGEISNWEAHCVYQRDVFAFELGDEAKIIHRPHLGADRGELIAAYSIVTFKDGEKSREVMSRAEIDAIRKLSRAQGGPWDSFYSEMARKTVARRHSKSLPMSSDLDDLMRRDDDLYDIEAKEEPKTVIGATGSALDRFATESVPTNGGQEPQGSPPAAETKPKATRPSRAKKPAEAAPLLEQSAEKPQPSEQELEDRLAMVPAGAKPATVAEDSSVIDDMVMEIEAFANLETLEAWRSENRQALAIIKGAGKDRVKQAMAQAYARFL